MGREGSQEQRRRRQRVTEETERLTLIPRSSMSPTLAHPERMLRLDVGQCDTPELVRLIVCSSVSSRCT